MSVITYTSSERAQERPGNDYPPCCGRTPLVLTWPKRHKGLVAIMCQNPACPNHAGVLCYGPNESQERWASFLVAS